MLRESDSMTARRFPIGRVTALAAIGVGAFVILRGGGSGGFKSLEPGVEFQFIRGEPYCRSGSSQIAVLRLDPARARVQVRHYTREPERRPLDIVEWQRRTRALAVFNAGQYYPDYSYMGLLVSGGRTVSSRLHPGFKAALVASPLHGKSRVRVLDLALEPIDPDAPLWREVAQSFMLFDRSGTLRVRHTDQVANRTAVAEDRDGRLLVITTEGGYTLFDFATLLKKAPLRITHAMSMDGGQEAELCVKTRSFRYASFGRWDDEHPVDAPGALVPLPAVIAIAVE
jgi:hypothetical protein